MSMKKDLFLQIRDFMFWGLGGDGELVCDKIFQ